MKMTRKHKLLLETAKTMFWKYGIKKVTVEDICEEAGISKMTYYRYYPNKLTLAKKILDEAFEASVANYNETMAMDIPFNEKVHKNLTYQFESTDQISIELINDIYKSKKYQLKDYFESRKNDATEKYLKDFQAAQSKGEIREDLSKEYILYMIQKIEQMSMDPELLKVFKGNTQAMIQEVSKFFFYGMGVKATVNEPVMA